MNETQKRLASLHRSLLVVVRATGCQRAIELLINVTIEMNGQGVVYVGDGVYFSVLDGNEVANESQDSPSDRTLN